jgi:pectate lyase
MGTTALSFCFGVTAFAQQPSAQQPRAGARRTIQVGPGKRFTKLSPAVRAARAGDVIEVDVRGRYAGDVLQIRTNNLTIRGVGRGRAKFPAAGKSAGRKGNWVVSGHNVVVENIEFSGARVSDKNGAGIRAEGRNITVRNCKFHDCENGILGGAGTVLIEHCEFSRCGLNGRAHNLYISHNTEKLVFRHNHSHHAMVGHLLKSRAKENHLLYNYMSDGVDGSSSYVVNFPNGGKCFLIGNVLCQSPRTQNSTLVAYGEEGIRGTNSELYLVNNTLVNNRRTGVFVNVQKVPAAFKLVAKNNIFAGRGTVTNWKNVAAAGNFSGGDPMFVDRAGFDFRLKPDSPCIDRGVDPGRAGGLDLKPLFQVGPRTPKRERPVNKQIDIGAIEYSAAP